MSKKGEKSSKGQSSYELRDVVLAKVRGFPPWPGMISDPESVPDAVMKERPNSKKAVFYCVRFFPAGDYAWLVTKDISKLQTHEIEAYINEPVKRSGDLLSAYRIALDPAKWEAEREVELLEAGEAEANAEIDQLASEDEVDGERKVGKPKKRKRDSEAASGTGKVKPKAKAKKDSEPGKKKTGGTKGKKNGTKSKDLVESEDDGGGPEDEDDDAGPSKKGSPPSKKSRRDKDGDEDLDPSISEDPEALKVREWRHKLQKTFLSQKGPPKDEEMPAMDEMFTTVETYEKITLQSLSFSKIGKVMRHIAGLPDEKVPRDEEFKFKERAQALVDRWQLLAHSRKANGNTSEGVNGKPDDSMQVDGKDAAEVPQEPATVNADVPASADVAMAEA